MIKPLDKDQQIAIVWPDDPAFDRDHRLEDGTSSIVTYRREAGRDPAAWRRMLKTLPDQQATEFVVGVIPPAELAQIEDECGGINGPAKHLELQWRCFAASLRDIRNGPTRDGAVPKERVGGVERVERRWLSDVFCRGLRDCAIWVGGVAWSWNKLSEDDLKNC
ncbi:MAG TPA: hypothetical protein VJ787_04860 [Thermoleophilia bacterium]|nr:hypothetical protein [Thermoleophilia bacterium]